MRIDDRDLNEETTKLRYITPALEKVWPRDLISMEEKISDGKIVLKGKEHWREKPESADYVLYVARNVPVAVVEAKRFREVDAHGLQQAMGYAEKLEVPFAFSSSGHGFREHDMITGAERDLGLDEFPSLDELKDRFFREKGFSESQIKAMEVPYYSGVGCNSPRYYQRLAVDKVMRAVAEGQRRMLLAMATGTGKTYTAFQIVYRLLKGGLCNKVLYLADRNVLVDQSIAQDFKPLESIIHKVDFAKEDPATVTAYQVYFSLYQQLSDYDDDDPEAVARKLGALFSPDFFDFVIVDECHRGSAKANSSWRKILEYFSPAVQIGMTATPKETAQVSNIDYFGEPIFTYSLKQGIEDGFLAPFRVVSINTNISDEWRPTAGMRDIEGKEIPDRIYNNSDYDKTIIIPERTRLVAEEITRFLRSTDRMSKTIVFCPTEDAALRMRNELAALNADMMRVSPDYVMRITSSDKAGKAALDRFISVGEKFPVIATTSKLLSTGVDTKMVKVVVFDDVVGSMTEFKQMLGRGTRIVEKEGKTFFTVLDFRNVTRLFADPDWDGPVIQDPGWPPRVEPGNGEGGGEGGSEPWEVYTVPQGTDVHVTNMRVSVYRGDGKLLSVEELKDYTRSKIKGFCSSLEDIRDLWSGDRRGELLAAFDEFGIDLGQLKADTGLSEADDFDFLCHLAFDKKPLTRRERAENVKKRDFVSRYGGEARKVIDFLLDRYSNYGINDIEDANVWKLEPFRSMGGSRKVGALFGGIEGWKVFLKDLEACLYSDDAV